MRDMSKMLEDVIKPRSDVHLFCSSLQFFHRYKPPVSQFEEQPSNIASDHKDSGSESGKQIHFKKQARFEMKKSVRHYALSIENNRKKPDAKRTAYYSVMEKAIHFGDQGRHGVSLLLTQTTEETARYLLAPLGGQERWIMFSEYLQRSDILAQLIRVLARTGFCGRSRSSQLDEGHNFKAVKSGRTYSRHVWGYASHGEHFFEAAPAFSHLWVWERLNFLCGVADVISACFRWAVSESRVRLSRELGSNGIVRDILSKCWQQFVKKNGWQLASAGLSGSCADIPRCKLCICLEYLLGRSVVRKEPSYPYFTVL